MGSGQTVGFPIAPGSPGPYMDIAEPLPHTHLTLARYAKIMGISPPHFFGATSSYAFPIHGGCEQVWPRHSWQDLGRMSREELLLMIQQVESEIEELIGYSLAPRFYYNEMHQYPGHYLADGISTMSGLNVKGLRKTILLNRGKLISSGKRGATSLGTATTLAGTLVYSDEDGDGFYERATISMPTTETSTDGISIFHYGTNAAPEWQIRHPLSVNISSGTLTMVFNSWLFIDPDIDGAYPTADDYKAMDISTTDNFVGSVDIYKVYVDNTQVSARFFWEYEGACSVCNGSGCDACSLTYQDGCFTVGNVDLGWAVPKPAEYNSDSGKWNLLPFAIGRDPDQVRLSYYAGDISQEYLEGRVTDPLKPMYAKAIAWMATARTSKPACSCPNLADNFESMRQDLARLGTDASYMISRDVLKNPFGTRRGEIMAWNLIGHLIEKEHLVEAAVI